jgi:hypothetical protein
MERGYAWLDMGTMDSFLEASEFVSTTERRQGLKIGCPQEIALRFGYVAIEATEPWLAELGNSGYADCARNVAASLGSFMSDVVAGADPAAGRAKHLLFAVLAIAFNVTACLLFAEIVLRFLPVATGMWAMPVNAENPISRFTPDRAFLFSRDWNFSLVNRGRINNDGFVNDENYAENDPRPLLAVVGDSYVEAAMVPNDKTFYATDAHWNAIAHEVAVEALASSRVYRTMFALP